MKPYNEYDTPFSRLCCANCPLKNKCPYEGYKDYQKEAVCTNGIIIKTQNNMKVDIIMIDECTKGEDDEQRPEYVTLFEGDKNRFKHFSVN